MVGINVPIPVPIAYYTFGGWKKSGFGDLNQHGPDSIRFYTKTKTITSRWPSGVKEGAGVLDPDDELTRHSRHRNAFRSRRGPDRSSRHGARLSRPRRSRRMRSRWDEEKHFPVDVMREAAKLGIGGIYIKDDVGGSAMTRFDAALIFEALATGCPTVSAFISIHNMASWMIDAYGNDTQRQKWLPKLCTMELIASYSLTEPGAGSTPRRSGPARYARAIITSCNGTSSSFRAPAAPTCWWRWCGPAAMVPAAFQRSSSTARRRASPSAPRSADGLERAADPRGDFRNARVPVENLLGDEGIGFRIAMAGLDGGRINIATCSVGARRARWTNRWPT